MSLSCPMERCRGMESVVGIVLNADGPGLRTTPATEGRAGLAGLRITLATE